MNMNVTSTIWCTSRRQSSLSEGRIKCDHHDITVTSANGAYGMGIIEVTWKCNDCGTVMKRTGRGRTVHYDTTAKEIQSSFEKVEQ